MKRESLDEVMSELDKHGIAFNTKREGHHYKIQSSIGTFVVAETSDWRARHNNLAEVRRRIRNTLMTTTTTGISDIARFEDKQITNIDARIKALTERVEALELVIAELTAKPTRQPKAPITHITAQAMASKAGCKANADAIGFLKLTARKHAKENNLEIKWSAAGASRKYEYFPMASAEFAMEAIKKSGLL